MEIKKLRKIFLGLWDPLLVGDNELLNDEYDDYINRIFDYLKNGEKYKEQIINLLTLFEKEIGAETDSCVKENIANILSLESY